MGQIVIIIILTKAFSRNILYFDDDELSGTKKAFFSRIICLPIKRDIMLNIKIFASTLLKNISA